MAFEAFLTQDRVLPRKGRRIMVALSLALHGGLLVAAVAYSFWHVDELSPPTVTVTFLANAPPPPPPPPPPKKRSAVTPTVTREIVQPRATDLLQPKTQQKEEQKGEENGVAGGVAGGVGLGEAIAAAPPPKEPDAPPKFLAPSVGGQLLLTDPRKDARYRVVMPPALSRAGMQLWAMLKVCVSKQGDVSDVKIIKGMDPTVDPLLQEKIKTWRYTPMTIDGRPAAFCYNVRYEHATQ
jgi:periplasmic protein TonB